MATSANSPNLDELVSEIHVAAPPERVFQALVDPAQVVQWWGQRGIYVCNEFEADLRIGGKWRSAGLGGDGRNFEVSGEFLEIVRPRLLVYSWIASWTGGAKTTVRCELQPAANGTRVTIRHSGLSARPDLAKTYQGWPRMLAWLQAFLDRGETVPQRRPSCSS